MRESKPNTQSPSEITRLDAPATRGHDNIDTFFPVSRKWVAEHLPHLPPAAVKVYLYICANARFSGPDKGVLRMPLTELSKKVKMQRRTIRLALRKLKKDVCIVSGRNQYSPTVFTVIDYKVVKDFAWAKMTQAEKDEWLGKNDPSKCKNDPSTFGKPSGGKGLEEPKNVLRMNKNDLDDRTDLQKNAASKLYVSEIKQLEDYFKDILKIQDLTKKDHRLIIKMFRDKIPLCVLQAAVLDVLNRTTKEIQSVAYFRLEIYERHRVETHKIEPELSLMGKEQRDQAAKFRALSKKATAAYGFGNKPKDPGKQPAATDDEQLYK